MPMRASGIVLDIVPNHMAASDENPFWARSRAAEDVLRRRHAHRLPPALLRHRRPRRRTRRGRGGVRGDTREGARARPRRSGRRPARRPRRRPGESARVSRPARARGRRARLGREDPRGRREAARVAGRGDDGLRVPERRRCASSSIPRRGAADESVCRADRRGAAVRGGRGGGEARAGAGTFEPELRRLHQEAAEVPNSPPRSRRSTSTARTSSRSATPSRTRTASRSRAPPSRRPRAHSPARGARLRRVRPRFQQATGAGDGERRRGHGVLPMEPSRRAERGRRRPGHCGRCRSTSSIARTSSAPRAFRATC